MLQIERIQMIDLGIQGENGAREISIDCNAWASRFEDAEFTLYHRRPGDAAAEAVTTDWDGETGILTWTPSEYDTAVAGRGWAEIRLQGTDMTKKTGPIRTWIRKCVDVSEEEESEP